MKNQSVEYLAAFRAFQTTRKSNLIHDSYPDELLHLNPDQRCNFSYNPVLFSTKANRFRCIHLPLVSLILLQIKISSGYPAKDEISTDKLHRPEHYSS